MNPLSIAPWFWAAVAVAAFIIGVRIVAHWPKARRAARELRQRRAARELATRQHARGHAHG